jgi:hypothetical protein
MPDITYTAILKKELEKIGGSIIRSNIVPNIKESKKDNDIGEDKFDIKEITLINILLEYPSLLDDKSYADYITNDALKEVYQSAKKEREVNASFKAVRLLSSYSDDHIIHKIITMESNEKSEDSARLTINEIVAQLEKNSNEKIYFDLLGRHSQGEELSDKEREFIKNFKK